LFLYQRPQVRRSDDCTYLILPSINGNTINNEKNFNFHRESRHPCLTTCLKCDYRKILSFRTTSRSSEEPLFHHSKVPTFVVYEMYSDVNEWVSGIWFILLYNNIWITSFYAQIRANVYSVVFHSTRNTYYILLPAVTVVPAYTIWFAREQLCHYIHICYSYI